MTHACAPARRSLAGSRERTCHMDIASDAYRSFLMLFSPGRLLLAASLAASMPHAAVSAEFVLVNKSGVTLKELYISRCGAPHWGANQLVGAALWSSRSFTISKIEPGCYDVMVVLPPWNGCIAAGVALRRTTAWTISWSTRVQASVDDCSSIANIASSGRRPWIANGP